GQDASWAARRARAVSLLAEADRLTALAELGGVGSLPGRERMVLLPGRLLGGAGLQQSARAQTDAYRTPGKNAAPLEPGLAGPGGVAAGRGRPADRARRAGRGWLATGPGTDGTARRPAAAGGGTAAERTVQDRRIQHPGENRRPARAGARGRRQLPAAGGRR